MSLCSAMAAAGGIVVCTSCASSSILIVCYVLALLLLLVLPYTNDLKDVNSINLRESFKEPQCVLSSPLRSHALHVQSSTRVCGIVIVVSLGRSPG